jgi:hypothetical protein
MEKLSQYEALRRERDALRHQFISAELNLALTFVGISKSTDDEERSKRNLNHARKAVEVARKYLGETNLMVGHEGRTRRKVAKTRASGGIRPSGLKGQIRSGVVHRNGSIRRFARWH